MKTNKPKMGIKTALPNNHADGKGEIILYKAEDGSTQIDVNMKDETVWLNQKQMAVLFDKDVRTINEHIGNIFREKELREDSVIRKFRITADDGKKYETMHYNLDVIISVGYRVQSQRGTQFRIWATNVLRRHLLSGYTLHQKCLQEKGLKDLEGALEIVRKATSSRRISGDEAKGILSVITDYTETWLLLRQYDDDEIPSPHDMRKASYVLTIDDARMAIAELRKNLEQKNETSGLFGQERMEMLDGIIGNIYQTFDHRELYPSIEEKAAHLLYFVIKDHPFSDGNKRIGTLLFLFFLDRNNALASMTLPDTMLVALALLIAESDPKQKDVMLRMILQFLKK